MRVKVLLLPALLLFGVGGPARAQEPKPVRVRASQVADSEGLVLRFAWRYAPGDAAGREVPGHDDSTWQVVLPALSDGAPPGWPGIGGFGATCWSSPRSRARPSPSGSRRPGPRRSSSTGGSS